MAGLVGGSGRGEGGWGTVTLHPKDDIEGRGGREVGEHGFVDCSSEGRRDEEADEGGSRSEQEEVDDLEGATEEILHSAPVFGEGFVVTASYGGGGLPPITRCSPSFKELMLD